MYLKLAWRNIWRNKRRTLITAASIFFAVILAIATRSAQTGSYENMIRNVVSFFTGYVQIHKTGYWEEQTLDNGFINDEELEQVLSSNKNIVEFVPRLESFALASSGENTKGTMVVGITPEKEKLVTNLDEKIVEGNYLSGNDEDAVLIAEGLAKALELGLNDTLVLMGQGYHGVTAAGKFPIRGIIRFGSPELNAGLVYLPIQKAQWMYSAENMLTSIVLMVNNPSAVEKISKELSNSLDKEEYEVMNWKEMLPELVQMIESDSAGGVIMIFVLYMVIGFGIFGTLLMMVNERMHEFGILVAIGMKNIKLSFIVLLETIMISFIGVFAGMLGAIPIVAYFYNNPIRFTGEFAKMSEQYGMEAIMPFSADPANFTDQAWAVLVMALLLALYPFYSILRLKAMEALRS